MPDVAPGQKDGFFTSYPWPYVEGITMAEATNDLPLMVTGAYGKPLPNSMGAPLRLHLPWKYGFKSIKGIVRISFTKERPVSFWETLGPSRIWLLGQRQPGGAAPALEPGDGAGAGHGRAHSHAALQWLWRAGGGTLCRASRRNGCLCKEKAGHRDQP